MSALWALVYIHSYLSTINNVISLNILPSETKTRASYLSVLLLCCWNVLWSWSLRCWRREALKLPFFFIRTALVGVQPNIWALSDLLCARRGFLLRFGRFEARRGWNRRTQPIREIVNSSLRGNRTISRMKEKFSIHLDKKNHRTEGVAETYCFIASTGKQFQPHRTFY